MAKRGTKSNPKAAPKYYSREEAIAAGSVPAKLFGINEAIASGSGTNLPLFSVRERSMAAAYAAINHTATLPEPGKDGEIYN